jgi:hypothetical protein
MRATTEEKDDMALCLVDLVIDANHPPDLGRFWAAAFGQRPEEGHVVLSDPEGNELCVLPPR